MTAWSYKQSQEDPAYAVSWLTNAGATIDFSTGYTFELKLKNEAGTDVLTKTSNITGAATTPNVIAAWAANELNITPGVYFVHLKANHHAQSTPLAPWTLAEVKKITTFEKTQCGIKFA